MFNKSQKQLDRYAFTFSHHRPREVQSSLKSPEAVPQPKAVDDEVAGAFAR